MVAVARGGVTESHYGGEIVYLLPVKRSVFFE